MPAELSVNNGEQEFVTCTKAGHIKTANYYNIGMHSQNYKLFTETNLNVAPLDIFLTELLTALFDDEKWQSTTKKFFINRKYIVSKVGKIKLD